jgi:DNA polymerase (family 10)
MSAAWYAATGLGYDYLVITDHSGSSVLANGMAPERVPLQHAEIDALNAVSPRFTIVKGIEVDILPDGSLDYDDDLLGRFDVVIASIHNAPEMTRDEATRRVVRALENRHTMILGHPTGRMLLTRTGYPLDMDRVIDAAIANGVALEINVNPGRLDLDWRHMRRARDRGARFVIGPDAHRIRGLNNIPYGVGVARKGWLRREDVLNCQPVGAFLQCLRKR